MLRITATHVRSSRQIMFVVLALALLASPLAWAQSKQPSSGGIENGVLTDIAIASNSTALNEANQPIVVEEKVVQAKSLLKIIQDGGILMIPIGACSIILFVFVFERLISLRTSRIIPRPFVTRFLEQLQDGSLDRVKALKRCDENPSAISEVFAAAVSKWGRPSVEVEQAILDTGERVAASLRSYLRLMNGIANISPLLGLFGTVLGMIQSFDAIGSATSVVGDPKQMIASGISVALITTAAGLTVAIPAMTAHLYFTGRVDRLIRELDSLGQKVVNLIASDVVRRESEARETTRSSKKSKAA
jgi:biopolymer transport protein ExbB